jgi:pyruvate dehydrogenase E2 component (dihydrolipoamide acetyltransferase)
VRSAPHFFLAVEVDGTALLACRAERASKLAAETRLTLTDLLVVITARTLARHRALNASFTADGIREWNTIDLGLAVALDDGLIVPVIREADRKSLAEIVPLRADFVARAQAGKLARHEVEAGTFTLSNLGALGVDFFTSILNPPQAGILSIGALAERPAVVNGTLVVRPSMIVGLTIDHRVTDGAAGARFLADLRARIETATIEE